MEKISVSLHGHATSISLEAEFYSELKKIAAADGLSVASLISMIDDRRIETGLSGLSGAIRVFILSRVISQRDAAMGPADNVIKSTDDDAFM